MAPPTAHHASLRPPARPGFISRWLRRFIVLGLGWFAAYHGLPRMLEMPRSLTEPAAATTSITDRHGQPLRQPLSNGQRAERLSFAQLPTTLVDATVSAEDQRFWTHGGIDGIGTVRATLDSLFAGRPVSGASTITQQLVKVASNRYTNRTWRDKVREMAYARKVEITWNKQRILTEYLQRVNYGNQTTGCAAASTLYFKKPVSDLSLAESAFLAGLPQAPTRLNPYRNFKGAKKRQEWVLSRMRADGRVTADEASRAAAEPLRLRRYTGGFEAPHFVEMLLAGHRQPDSLPSTTRAANAADQPASHPAESSPEEIEPAAGLEEPGPSHLLTTLDLELQQFCETAIRQRLARLQGHRVRQGAVVVLDNQSGGLRAMVGSPDFFSADGGQINGALVARSAGSTLKPFAYLRALELGDSPATIVDDLPLEFATATGLYAPHNYDRRCHGPLSYREALGNSLNLAAVRVLRRLGGPADLHATLQSLGLTTLSHPPDYYGLGLILGNAEVSLLELANAYACLARLGHWRPVAVRASDEPGPAPLPLFDPDACWLIADMLSDAQARARCFGLDSPLRLPFPAAVKTGTSTDFRDNWCLGYTPEFTVAVWMGNVDRHPMDRVSGVTGAAPVWRDIMTWLADHRGVTWYPQPDTIAETEVDPLTGEQLPPHLAGRRPVVRIKFALDSPPPRAPDDRYDELARVRLPSEYARWLTGPENWLGTAQAVVAPEIRRPHTAPPLILSPIAGSTVFLDPDLPGGGRQLPLRASTDAASVQWSSPSLTIEHVGANATAHLTPGRHHIHLHDQESGEHTTATITVKSF